MLTRALEWIGLIAFVFYVWNAIADDKRQHDVKVCLMEMGMGQTIYDPGVSQRCRDLIAEEAVRLQEKRGK